MPPRTRVRTPATRTARMLTLAVGMRRAPSQGREATSYGGLRGGVRAPRGGPLRLLRHRGGVRPPPQARPGVHQYAGEANAAADEVVLVQEPEPAEDIVPVVLAAAHEREQLGARVLNVDRDVPEE